MADSFLASTREDETLNQYWYSANTIAAMVEELEEQATRVAFLSTPSVYFSLAADSKLRPTSKVFDLDEQWAREACFVRYDFTAPEALPADLLGTFDCLVIDPPFITEDVWAKYAVTARRLLQPGGKLICSTIAENADMMRDLLGVKRVAFQPSIPNLIYQYDLYTNFEATALGVPNPEVPGAEEEEATPPPRVNLGRR